MRVSINGWFCGEPWTGIGQYTANLVRALATHSDTCRLTLYVRKDAAGIVDGLGFSDTIRIIHITMPRQLHGILQQTYFERALLFQVKEGDAEILHTPYLFGPGRRIHGMKHVVTIHDAIPKIFPEYKGGPIRRSLIYCHERHLRNVDLVLTDSRFSKISIGQHYDLSGVDVKVVPLAADPIFGAPCNEEVLQFVRHKYCLPDRFILYVGGFDRRKNVARLVNAYAKLKRTKPLQEKLILVGRYAPTTKQLGLGLIEDIPTLITDLGIGSDVFLVGFIPSRELNALYRMATLFVYPSLAEGFGLPVLEGMSCGVPVISSRCTSIPEIIDRADLLFDPSSVDSISEKIAWLLASPERRQEASSWGLERAGRFSWASTATCTLDAYQMVC